MTGIILFVRAVAAGLFLLGLFLIGAYLWTAAGLFLGNAPDKSPLYWYLIFPLAGILFCGAGIGLWGFGKKNS